MMLMSIISAKAQEESAAKLDTERTPRVLFGIEFSEKPGAIIFGIAWGLYCLVGCAGGS